MLVAGYGSITIIGFIWTLPSISPEDGKCRVGLRRFVTIPLLSFDFVINTFLTLVFVYHLGPVIRSNSLSIAGPPISCLATCLGYCCQPTRSKNIKFHTGNSHVAKRIENLLWRTLIGSCLVLISTIANLTQMTILGGKEMGFLCLLLCNCDSTSLKDDYCHRAKSLVTWTAIVFHWLSTASEPDPRSSVVSVPRFTSCG
jgi:hypothetical protein